MTKLPEQFIEDRALRDAARGVFMADVEHARASISGKGIAERVGSRVGDGAKDVFEVAKVHADDKRGILAALIGAIVLFFAREPILEILGIAEPRDHEDAPDLDIDTTEDVVEPDDFLQEADESAPTSGETDER